MTIARMLGVAIVITAATWFMGWWAVPLGSAGYALLRRGADGTVREATLGAMVSWAALLGWQASQPAFGRLGTALRDVFPVPTVVLLLVVVCFAGLLAWSAARLVHGR